VVSCGRCGEDDDLSATSFADGRREIVCGRCGHRWVRGEAALPPTRTAEVTVSPTHEADADRESPTSVNERAITAVVDELGQRGAACRIVRDGGRRQVLVVGDVDGREVVLTVRGRTSGDWQTNASYGRPCEPERMPYRFWVFVDLLDGGPEFYVQPEWEVLSGIHRNHQAYLDANDGHRVRNDDSDHHRIETDRVAEGRDAWEQLRIFH
jgi:hypothetical protein